MKKCSKCKKDHSKNGIFCSRSCANSRNWSNVDKLKLSKSVKQYYIDNFPYNKGKTSKIKKYCLTCNNEFLDYQKSTKIYCSRKCNPKVGGYRNGSGRSKSGYYKGIYCGSTYELAWIIYQIDNNISFERFSGYLEYNGKKYYPDFIQNDTIIEIKGYEKQESVDLKNDIAIQNGYNIVVLRKEDLQKEFDWIETHYRKELHNLYDDYKPQYKYTCDRCNTIYTTDKKRKKEKNYCSRKCSMLDNRMKICNNNNKPQSSKQE